MTKAAGYGMNLTTKVISKKLSDSKRIKSLYKSAFPKKERFPNIVLRIMMVFKVVEAFAFYDEDKLCGFSYLIVQDETIFVMYLAVNDEMRGMGYGSEILNCIKSEYSDKTIILDVEELDEQAENYEQRARRIAFYKKNGFYRTKLFFSMRGVRYEIMATAPSFTQEEYNKFWADVYKKKRGKSAH